jgi:hypothetical protein
MADGIVQLQPPGTGSKVDTSELTVAGNVVERQRVVIADPTNPTRLATVSGTNSGLSVDIVGSLLLPVDNPNLDAGLSTLLSTADFDTKVGPLAETAPATDTASSGLNGRLQRIAQRLTSLLGLLPSALTGSGNLKVAVVESTATVAISDGGGSVTVDGTVGVTNANLDAGLSTLLSTADFDTKVGPLAETAPATDTASSGLNGRLQRIAQRITSLIALVPAALTGSGNFKVSIAESTATVTVGDGGGAVSVDDNGGSLTVDGSVNVAGDVASGSSDSGNPVKIGGIGKTAAPTAVTDGQRVNALFDKTGRQIHARTLRELVVRSTTAIAVNTETTILAQVAATFLDITHMSITNSSATAVTVTIRDTTGGSAMAVYDIPANGGIVLHFDPGMMQTTVNTNWTAQVSSAVSTIHVNVVAMKSA